MPQNLEQNLSQYHIFHAVAQTGNISKAARKLYISQPAISNVPLEGNIRATYRFTDLYNQHYWTPAIP